jgi:hypothetical protein
MSLEMTKVCLEEYPFKSHSSDKVHTVKRWDDNSLSCNCPGWVFKRGGNRSCRHTEYVEQMIRAGIPQLNETSPPKRFISSKETFNNNQIKPQPIQPAKRYFCLEDE